MKKLKLAALNLGAQEILTRSQLKNILGGSLGSEGSGGGGGCTQSFSSCCVECKNGHGKTRDCGLGVSCDALGTSIRCGTGAYVEMCP